MIGNRSRWWFCLETFDAMTTDDGIRSCRRCARRRTSHVDSCRRLMYKNDSCVLVKRKTTHVALLLLIGCCRKNRPFSCWKMNKKSVIIVVKDVISVLLFLFLSCGARADFAGLPGPARQFIPLSRARAMRECCRTRSRMEHRPMDIRAYQYVSSMTSFHDRRSWLQPVHDRAMTCPAWQLQPMTQFGHDHQGAMLTIARRHDSTMLMTSLCLWCLSRCLGVLLTNPAYSLIRMGSLRSSA